MSSAEPNHIIAIGASAGGMDELHRFFEHTPLDGVAYVIIQHLSADFKSRMVQLLAIHSTLSVVEAGDSMPIQPNVVYFIPNDKFMTVHDNRLFLSDRHLVPAPHLTINKFFHSLASAAGSKAIGIILSGMGSDGTAGIRSIKNAGGLVIARNPENAEFSSMPSSAISSGLVDLVLEPEDMPQAVLDYANHVLNLTGNNPPEVKYLFSIIELIKEKLPLDFSEYKQATLLRRTKRRSAYHNFPSLQQYFDFLKTSPEEIELLSKDFLISVTSFFRDKEAFKAVQELAMPRMLNNLGKGEELKIWVAGCATGEEAYSLAMIISEQLKNEFRDTVVKIFATDIDHTALEHAGRGVYAKNSTDEVPADLLEKYFLREGDNYRIIPALRRMVIFAQHDLVKNPPYCNMHLVSCRNLLIYMTPVLQKKIFSMLLFGLRKYGYLLLGSSENPMPILKHLEVVHGKAKLYKSLESKHAVTFDAFSLPSLLEAKRPAAIYLKDDLSAASGDLPAAISLALIQETGGLAICIDDNFQVLKSYGDTTRYLFQRNFTLSLADLLPAPLMVAFNTLVHTVARTGEKVGLNGVQVAQGGTLISVRITVSRLALNREERQLYLVTLFEEGTGPGERGTEQTFNGEVFMDQYTRNLEDELKEIKAKLYSAYGQIDAYNENMQSFNEELISANEEMQSTNEEMQSVNEELHTINADYQLKNKELLEINDDLNNYFRSNINGQLFIDKNMVLMKFSPGTVQQINLRESDIGRPISHISTNIKFETIIEDIQQVMDSGIVITKEIETVSGMWFQLMTMPYLMLADNSIGGAIITFNDITALKKAQFDLDSRNRSLVRINTDLDHFIHAASHDLLAPLSNIESSVNVMTQANLSAEELKDFCHVLQTSVRTFRSLITDISTIAKVESDIVTVEQVDLDEILDNIEWSLESRIRDSGAVIKRTLEIDSVGFPKKNLRSILYNLIANSIKFRADQAPVVHFHARKVADGIVLSVEDNGKGIPPEGLTKIFDMYGRLHPDIEGSGIGLYLAKKIVNAAGGSIEVESTVGKGSKFSIYLKNQQEGEF